MVRVLLAVLAATLCSSIGHAQSRVSEGEFLSILRDGHPGLAALSERVVAARAERVRAGLLPNPVASFEREAPRDAAEQITWQLSWTPPLDGRREAAVCAGRAGVQAATYEFEAARLALRTKLREAFADWAISVERSAMVEDHLGFIARLAEQMRARATSGEESGLAARRLSLAALEVKAEAARSAATAARARAVALAWHHGLPAESQAERPALPILIDTVAMPVRSDLLARRFEVEQAEWQLRRARRFLQFPELAFGWQQIREETTTLEGPRIGLSWPLPLFDRQQPDRIDAFARLVSARGRLELASARAVAELAASRAAYPRLRATALQAMEEVAASDRVIESATATFRLGESRLTDLLETMRSVLAARLAALDLYGAALEAHRALELAAGRPLTEDGGSR